MPSDLKGLWQEVVLGRHAKRKPPNQKVRRPVIPTIPTQQQESLAKSLSTSIQVLNLSILREAMVLM